MNKKPKKKLEIHSQLNDEQLKWCVETVDKICSKMLWVREKSRKKIPYTTKDGIHDDKSDESVAWSEDDGINWWTNGFWSGIMWQMFHETKDQEYADIAEYSENVLDQCIQDYYGLHHDVGFMWMHTAVAHYRKDKGAPSRKRAMHAANLLSGRFNPAGNFIRAWNGCQGKNQDTVGWAIIDCLMNLPLLYWASEESQDPRFMEVAMRHADTVIKNFIRVDGSVEHIVEFNPFTGEKVRVYGGQGYAEGSSWTRGQAWGIYGFALNYIHTGKSLYLDTAMRIADYFIMQIPKNYLIPIDFCQPETPHLEDATAAAIAASGLIEIARYSGERNYLDVAVKLLETLSKKRCNWSTSCDCIVEKCSAAYHDSAHEYSIIYGDYFFIEAIFKLKGSEVLLW